MRRRTWFFIISAAALALVLLLTWWSNPRITPFGTIKVYDRNNTLLYESSQAVGSKQPVTFDQLPQSFIDATIATEDETFWHNPGIDPKAIMRSTWLNLSRQKIVSGASTITQQAARATVIAPNGRAQRSLVRKIREALIALRLTFTYSKQAIFELYSNTVYFGNQTYGVQAAARLYFGKDVNTLSLAETAFLAGLLASPEARNPYTHFEQAKRAQEQTLARMAELKMLSEEEQTLAAAEILTISPPDTTARAPHFVQEVLRQVDTLGIDPQQGLRINTTLDLPTYELSESVAKRVIASLTKEHDVSNAALVLLDNQTGDVISMLGGIDFSDATHSGQVNMATALRQPGSALKPITYARAFMQGETPASMLSDVNQVFPTKSGEGFSPNNYDGKYRGPVLARTALASSLNIPAVEMLQRIGVPALLEQSRLMGITSFTQTDRYDLALTLGGGEVRLLELSNAYATLARGGKFLPTHFITDIMSDDGTVLFSADQPKAQQVMGEHGPAVSYLITDILSDAKARLPGFGERSPLSLSLPASVKTGTTTDWHDNWTIGYTPSYTVGVWVGNNDNHPMVRISGVVGAAPIWQQFFEEFLKDKPREEFERPPGIVEQAICAETGLLPTPTCSSTRIEVFREGTQPTEAGSLRNLVTVDVRNGLLAGPDCPPQFTTQRLMWQFPNRLYSWARNEGLPLAPTEWSPLCPGGDDEHSVSPTGDGAGDSHLQITFPKQRAVFESAPQLLANESIVFEAAVSQHVHSVTWLLDGTPVATSNQFPFSASWKPRVGDHTLRADAVLRDGSHVVSQPTQFTVVEYQAQNDY